MNKVKVLTEGNCYSESNWVNFKFGLSNDWYRIGMKIMNNFLTGKILTNSNNSIFEHNFKNMQI